MKHKVLKIIPKSKNLIPVSIGGNNPLFTIAEIGLNHNGDIKLGKKLIDAAHDAGCTSVKFQNFETEEVYIEGEKNYNINIDLDRSVYTSQIKEVSNTLIQNKKEISFPGMTINETLLNMKILDMWKY